MNKVGKHRTFRNEDELDHFLHTGDFALMSAYTFDNSEEENEKAHNKLIGELIDKGHDYTLTNGMWSGSQEPSVMIHGISSSDIKSLAKQFKQYAHITSKKGIHTDHSNNVEYQPLPGGKGHMLDSNLDDNYSSINLSDGIEAKFQVNLGNYESAGPAISKSENFSVINKSSFVNRMAKYDKLINKAPEGKVFVSMDGDNIGASVQRAAMSDDLETITKQHKLIMKGQALITKWAKKHDAIMYISGGDDSAFYIDEKVNDKSDELFKLLDALKEEYTRVTGFTTTIGVGPSISRAGHAMLYGKLNGKDQVVEWTEEIEEKLKFVSKVLTPEEKYIEEGLLPDIAKGDVINMFSGKKINNSKQLQESPKQSGPSWKDKLYARFATHGDSRTVDRMLKLHSKKHPEPYADGDTHGISWGPAMTEGTKQGKMWNRPIPIPVDVDPKLSQGVLGRDVPLGGTDPFSWLDQKYQTGKTALKDHKGLPLQIHTRSDLISHDAYIEHLDPEHHTVNMHVFGDNDAVGKKLEIGAPSFKRRMKAVKKLQAQGIKVNIVHDQMTHDDEFLPNFQGYNKLNAFKNQITAPVKTNQVKLGPAETKRIQQALGLNITLKKTIKEMKLKGLNLGPQQGSKIISTPAEKETLDARFNTIQGRAWPQIKHKNPDQKPVIPKEYEDQSFTDTMLGRGLREKKPSVEKLKQGYKDQVFLNTGKVPASGFTTGDTGQAYVGGHLDPKRIDPIAAHENMHQLFHAVETNYGHGARRELASGLANHITPFARNHIMKFMHKEGDAYSNTDVPHEELLAYLHTYQTDPLNRGKILPTGKSPLYRRVLDRAVKSSWKAVLEASDNLTPKDARFANFRHESFEKSKKNQILAPSSKSSKQPATIHGELTQPNDDLKTATRSFVDQGTMHTPRGSFPIQIPGPKDSQYEAILNAPDIQALHSKAMSNWFQLHQLHQSGQQIPDELIAHSNIFSILSANTPVPTQELSYSRLVDTVKDRQLDFRDPKFAIAFSRKGKGRIAWKRSDNPDIPPEHARAYWEGQARDAITQQNYSEGTGRIPGDIKAFGSKDSFSDRMSKYPASHQYLADLVHMNKGDVQLIVSKMMQDKANIRLPKDHPMKLGVGLGAKTGRYAMSMLGGGNAVIPDTHFVRHIFGLDQKKDQTSISYLKNILWNPRNHHILNQLDDYYHKNHPAARFVQKKYFGGNQDPNSTFAAFWLHWLSIAPHEKAQGIGNPHQAKNLTDHTPFWDSAQEILDKHGLGVHMKKNQQSPVYVRTAAAAMELDDKLGSAPASMVFYAHLLPHLMNHIKLNKSTGTLNFHGLGLKGRPEQQVSSIGTQRQADINEKVIGEKVRRQLGDDYAGRGEEASGNSPNKMLDSNAKFKTTHKRRMSERGAMSHVAGQIADAKDNQSNVVGVNFQTGKVQPSQTPDFNRQKAKIQSKAQRREERISSKVGASLGSGLGGETFSLKQGVGEGPQESPHAMVPEHNIGESQQHHEALHLQLGEIANKHGDAARHATINHLLTELHPEDRQSLEHYVADKGYDPKSPMFNEELVSHLRDILNDPLSRDSYAGSNKLMHLTDDDFQGRMSRHKQAWRGMMGKAKNMKPEFFNQRLAMSEKKLKKTAGMMKLKGLKNINTRPESNITGINTERQADIAGRKAVQREVNAGVVEVKGKKRKGLKDFYHGVARGMVPDQNRKKTLRDLIKPVEGNQGAVFYSPKWKEGGFGQVAGENVGTPIEHHEAHHSMFSEVDNKYGQDARKKLVDHLLTNLHPDDYSSIQIHLGENYGYDTNHPRFNEEILNHAKDIIDHEGSRSHYMNALHHKHLSDDEKHDKMSRHKSSWKKILQSASKITPEFFGEKLAASEKELTKSNKVDLVHYSQHSGLQFIDPDKMGSGWGSKQDRNAGTNVAYFYRKGTQPEEKVLANAKSIYHTTIEPHQELYDLHADKDGIQAKVKEKNYGALNRDEMIQTIKDSGYHGYYHPKSGLPNAVALFHEQPIHTEESLRHSHPHGYDWHDGHSEHHKEGIKKNIDYDIHEPKQLHEGSYIYTVEAYHRGKKVGNLHYAQNASTDGYHNVRSAAIHENHRGKGVYQSMLQMASDHAKTIGSKGIKSRGFQRGNAADKAWKKQKDIKSKPGKGGGEDLFLFEKFNNYFKSLLKAKHPHIESHGPVVNDQVGGEKSDKFHDIMSNWGTLTPNKTTNLKFYKDLHNHEDKIDNQVSNHGYSVYTAGGSHGKPDLKNKNYNTKHLMIYDPTEGSGGDFGQENFTRSWRKSHELAHALTLNDINNKYGEGRRLGKLGVRTPKEMKRATEWEWMAAHKQRDLMKDLGYHIEDEDFNKELNTVMSDATHRAVTGKFTDPHTMGFEPHSHKVDLKTSLNLIDSHAKSLGLEHDNDTSKDARNRQQESIALDQNVEKSENLNKSPLVADFADEVAMDTDRDHERIKLGQYIGHQDGIHTSALNNGNHYHYITDNGNKNGNIVSFVNVRQQVDPNTKQMYPSLSTSVTEPAHKRQGMNEKLTRFAADFHGGIYSDSIISPNSQKKWQKVNAQLAPTNVDPIEDHSEYDEFVGEAEKSPTWLHEDNKNTRHFLPAAKLIEAHKLRMSKSEKYSPKHGDTVHLSHGISDLENGGEKVDTSKKFTVRGKQKDGYHQVHWVVPVGEKNTSKGSYHRSDRIHLADSMKKSEDDDYSHYDVDTPELILNREGPLSRAGLHLMTQDIDKHNKMFDDETGTLHEDHPDYDNIWDFWDNHIDRITNRLDSSIKYLETQKRQKRIKNSGLKVVKEEMGKSNYGPAAMKLYDQANNARRKSKRTSTNLQSVGPNSAVQSTKPTSNQQADSQAKADMKRNKKMPIKTYTPEQAKAMGIGVNPPKKKNLRSLLGKKSLLKFTDSSKKHDNGRGNYNHHGKLVGTPGITGTHSHGGVFTHGGLDTFDGEISSNMIARPGGGVMVLVSGDVKHEHAGGELRFKHEDDARNYLSSMKVKTPAEIQAEMDRTGIPF